MEFPFSMVIVRRVKPLPYWITPILALIVGLLISIIILYGMSGGQITPYDVLASISYGFINIGLLAKTFSLLTIVGIGLLVSFKGAIWNIGGEGQFYIGVLVAAWVSLFSGLAMIGLAAKTTMIILGLLAGAFWALLAALPRAYLGVDEVPVTLMMNYIAYYIVDYLASGAWRERHYGYYRTVTIPQTTWFNPIKIGNIPVTISYELLTILVIVFVGVWLLFKYTSLGLRIKILSSNPDLLRSSGISVPMTILLALTISGLIIGIAGASYLAQVSHNISYPVEEKTPVYGYTGILVAWLAMLELFAVPIAAYIMSALYNAGIQMQVIGAGGAAVVNVFIGSILLTYAVLVTTSEYQIRIIRKKKR
ncbi:ABC transporter permease [Staphylothermus hellenicus]|nr:ABC transporter permease [Staphylothermus hellenicus]